MKNHRAGPADYYASDGKVQWDTKAGKSTGWIVEGRVKPYVLHLSGSSYCVFVQGTCFDHLSILKSVFNENTPGPVLFLAASFCWGVIRYRALGWVLPTAALPLFRRGCESWNKQSSGWTTASGGREAVWRGPHSCDAGPAHYGLPGQAVCSLPGSAPLLFWLGASGAQADLKNTVLERTSCPHRRWILSGSLPL